MKNMTLEHFIEEYQAESAPRWQRAVKTLKRFGAGMGITAMTLLPMNALAGQIIPYVTPDTHITVTNPTSKTMTGEVRYAAVGDNPETATAIAEFTLPPFGTASVENKLPPDAYKNEGSAYVETDAPSPTTSNPSPEAVEAAVTARVQTPVTTFDIPVVDADAKNNRDPQAGILVNSLDREIILSGDSTSNNTLTFEARSPDGTGSLVGDPIYASPNTVGVGLVSDLYSLGFPHDNASHTIIPKYPDESRGAGLLLFENLATGDQRISPMQNFTPAQLTPADVAKAYVQQWLPSDGRVYLDNKTARAMINGDEKGTPSYAQDLATILANSSGANGQTVNQLVQWLKDQTDCNLSNEELCNVWDPVQWNNSDFGVKGFYFLQNNCDDNAGFPLGATDMQATYDLIKTQFLWRYVMDNPELFGGSAGGLPDMSFNPGWYTNDQDNFSCP